MGLDGKERVLHKFQIDYNKQRDGYYPQNSVVQDAAGNLYGTTWEGGIHGGGVLYEITTDGKENILHAFCSEDHCLDGGIPNDLIIDANGNLYGTTYGGGINGNGVIFMITP